LNVSFVIFWLKKHGHTFNTNILPKLEIGVAGFRYDHQDNENYVNAKFSILSESVLNPGLTVGIEGVANIRERSAYAVASKALPFGFRMHVSAGNGRFDGVFAGIEKNLNPISVLTGNNVFPETTLIAEYDVSI